MKQIYIIPSGIAVVLLLMTIFHSPLEAQISQEACQTVLLDRTYEQMRRETSIIQQMRNTVRGRGAAASTDTIPVFFTVFRHDDGSFAGPEIDAALADSALQQLNRYFAPIRLVFVRLGAINYIDHTIFSLFSRHHHLARFSYLSTALNVYSKSGSGSFAQFPSTFGAVTDYDPHSLTGNRSNMISLNPNHFLTTSFAHEVGHSYGLLHTFEGARVYHNPVAPTPNYPGTFADHPYGDMGNNRRRELVIRQPDLNKAFGVPNAATAGDFVEDTPAFCVSTYSYPDYYPSLQADQCDDYPFDRSRCNGCIVVGCDYEGDYVDYNGDTLINTQVSIRNLMSYTSCRSEFTPGQYERMSFYHEQVRKKQYDHQQLINFSDTVFFEDSHIPMKNILVQISHPGADRHSNMTTGTAGSFQGILYQPWVNTRLLKAGTATDPNYRTSAWAEASLEEIILHSYRPSDWAEGVDEKDLDRLRLHLSGEKPLNGYQQLAADLNADGQLTEVDAQLMQQLIRGEIKQLEAHDAPWKFLPAYIPGQHPIAFHGNPFDMEIAGVRYHHFAPYLEEDWMYNAAKLPEQLRGFRGIKLADLNGSSQQKEPEQPEPEDVIKPATGLDALSARMQCFPNPTSGKVHIIFNASESSEATLSLYNRWSGFTFQREITLEAGRNVYNLNASGLPPGLFAVVIKSPENIYYRKMVKVSAR